jgi:anti-anti-sigma regulatory factor
MFVSQKTLSMKVKIDTKEKFDILALQETILYANMTEELNLLLLSLLEKDKKSVVLNLKDVDKIDENVANSLLQVQLTFYTNNLSFVICGVRSAVKESLDAFELLDMLNIAPTESEASDLVQMEEIERELDLFGDE